MLVGIHAHWSYSIIVIFRILQSGGHSRESGMEMSLQGPLAESHWGVPLKLNTL